MKPGRPLIDFLPDDWAADSPDADAVNAAQATVGGPSLREVRLELGINQATMARALGIGRTTWWRWETGRGEPVYPRMLRLALAFMAAYKLSRRRDGLA